MPLNRPENRVLLNGWARWFLDGTPKLLYREVITRLYPDGRTEQTEPRPVYGPADKPEQEVCGERFAAVYPLCRYRFSDGREYREVMQTVMRDRKGQLVYLLALQTADGKEIIESRWGVKEIAEAGFTPMSDDTG